MAARLACWLGDVTRPDTLLRCRRVEPSSLPTPRVLGVEECALRRGHTSATWLVDWERQQPGAGLEGRTAESLMQWRQAHGSVTSFVHDRAEAYPWALG